MDNHCIHIYSNFSQKGASLVEVLIALIIFSLASVLTLSTELSQTKLLKKSKIAGQVELLFDNMAARLQINKGYFFSPTNPLSSNIYLLAQFQNHQNLPECTEQNCHCLEHPVEIPNCSVNLLPSCTAVDMAMYDSYQMACLSKAIAPDLIYGIEILPKTFEHLLAMRLFAIKGKQVPTEQCELDRNCFQRDFYLLNQ